MNPYVVRYLKLIFWPIVLPIEIALRLCGLPGDIRTLWERPKPTVVRMNLETDLDSEVHHGATGPELPEHHLPTSTKRKRVIDCTNDSLGMSFQMLQLDSPAEGSTKSRT